MTLDSLSYTAPARLRALLCPFGRIRRSRFSAFVARLQTATVVRLGDVTPDSQPNRSMFNPLGFPDGRIMWDLTTSMDREHEYLEMFELNRRTFVVLAVADYNEGCDPEAMREQWEDLKLLYPNALYRVCLIFDAPAEVVEHEKLRSPDGHPRFLTVPPVRDSRTTSMRTLMCDITAAILSELCVFAKSLQVLPTLESPLSPENRTQRDRRNSMPSGGGLAPFGGELIATKRKSLAGFGGNGNQSERARNKGKGRVQIAIAQLHLMTGRVPDALKEFVEGADICKGSSDHLWHGKALEGVGVCLMVLANLGVPFQIPVIPYPTVEGSKSTKASPAPSKPSTPNPTGANGVESATPLQVLDLLPELHKCVVSLYQRASNFAGEEIPHICYCETVLRYTKLLVSMYLANGTSTDAIAHVVSGTPIPHKGPRTNNPPRISIAENAMRAYPQPIEVMTVLEATKVLSGIASILGAIGMKRRKALVTRELLKILVPGLIQARVVGAAEAGIHPAAGLSTLNGRHGSPLDLGEGDVESGIMELLEDLCRVYGILSSLHEAKDEDESAPRPASNGAMATKTSFWTKAVIAEQEIRSFGWPALKVQVLKNCASLCEALPDFQGVLNFTTQLLRTADMELSREEQIKLSTTISRTVGAARKLGLSGVEADYWDQFLLRDIELVESTTWRPPIPHNRNELVDSGSPTAAIEAEKGPFIYNPFKVSENSTTAEQILVKGEPAEFRVTLQNPFEFEVEVESVTLDATGVDLKVQQVGVIIPAFRTYQVSVFATPNDTGGVYISGCRIKVYGCKERSFPIFTGGLDPRERETKTKKFGLKAAEPKAERPVSTVSTIRRGSLRPPPVLHPIPQSLSLTVVDSQPLLVVKNTSLSQSALMVLEGERKIFQITLMNLSGVEVDLLVFSFTDSTTGRIQQALAEKTNSPAETYELELMLAKRRAFIWHRPRPKSGGDGKLTPKLSTQDLTKRKVFIPANGSAVFEIEVLGKPGLTHGIIQADYSHLGRARSEVVSRFYTREVVYPVTVTVNASVELVRVDFIPFSTDFILAPRTPVSADDPTTAFGPFKELFSGTGIYDDPSEYCLMLLDLRNAWPQPLRINLAIKDTIGDSDASDGWANAFTSEDVLHAGHTTRIILPVKRIFLADPYAPIPSLSTAKRQFVVSTTKISVEHERQSREAFWFREHLLQRLRGTWAEPASPPSASASTSASTASSPSPSDRRTGDIELRSTRLTPRMVETLRVEDIGVALSVRPGPNTNEISPSKFIVATDAFLTLATTVTNRTARAIRPVVRLQPSIRNVHGPAAFELSRRLAVNGLLQSALPTMAPGEERTVETGLVVLAKGEYEISASVEEVGGGGSGDGGGEGSGGGGGGSGGGGGGGGGEMAMEGLDSDGRPVDILGGRGARRRSWVCRELCLLVARDVA